MAGFSEIDKPQQLKGIRHKIRETLQVLQLQYGMVERAVDLCIKFEEVKNYKECRIAAGDARNELKHLLQTSERLIEEVRELNEYVLETDFFKVS